MSESRRTSGIRSDEDDHQLKNRSIEETLAKVAEMAEKQKLALRYPAQRSLAQAREQYRIAGEKHPVDEPDMIRPKEPVANPEIFELLWEAIRRMREDSQRNTSYRAIMDILLDRIDTKDAGERLLYHGALRERLKNEAKKRRENNENLWKADLEAAE
ncbi:hypothetical protein HY414_02515 [Candidatus Kaiserbacteria bacterium]|nr:hypothetical protein [Candidatus Kaiserbacteria bacterium]